MIAIDGIIFSLQRRGGISVYFHKLLDYLKSQRVQTTLMLDDPVKQNLNRCDAEIPILSRSARILERYRSSRIPPGASLFHSSYYRLPEKTSLPSVVTIHDFAYERLSHGPRRWVHSWQKNAAIRAAQAIICVSESTKQDLLEYVGANQEQSVHVIHNGVSDVFRPLALLSTQVPFVLYVGQRGGYKNFALALRAMKFLPDFELHCVGGGDFHQKELETVPDSVTRRVKHLGYVNDEELNALYNRAICLVYPSNHEGFGIPVVEAMRAGCPVVSVACKAVMEVGGDALTVAEGLDPKALADAILKIASSYRLGLIEKGFSVAQAYSWENTHSKTLEVYRSLSG
jgi:mannosyltransferase